MKKPLFPKKYILRFISSFIAFVISITFIITVLIFSNKDVIGNTKESAIIANTTLYGPGYDTKVTSLAKGTPVKILAFGSSSDNMVLVETTTGMRGWVPSYDILSRNGVVIDDFTLYRDAEQSKRYRRAKVGEKIKFISKINEYTIKISVNDSIFFIDSRFGDLSFESESGINIFELSSKAVFHSKTFDQKVLGRTIEELEDNYAVSVCVIPGKGGISSGNFVASFPFNVCDYSEKTSTLFVDITFEDGKAVSYTKDTRSNKDSRKWTRNKFNPLATLFIQSGIMTSAWQYNGVRPGLDGKEFSIDLNKITSGGKWWQKVLQFIIVIALFVGIYLFIGYLPYFVLAPLFSFCRYSAMVSYKTAKILTLLFGTLSYIIFFSLISAHFGFMWLMLVVLFLGWRRVYFYTLLFIPGKDYLSFLSYKCTECNSYDSYKEISRVLKEEYEKICNEGNNVYTHTTNNEWNEGNIHYIQPVKHYRHEVWRKKILFKIYIVTKECTECGARYQYEDQLTELLDKQRIG